MERRVYVVTSNAGKLKEIAAIIGDTLQVVAARADLPELQGETEEIAEAKCRAASSLITGPVLIDDSSLCFNALDGLPGPYIKWFLDKLQPGGLFRLLLGFEDKTAVAQCTLAYCAGLGHPVRIFSGRVPGKIVEPRGQFEGRGWYPCFQPDGSSQTFGEMTDEEINRKSHRFLALTAMRRYLLEESDLQ